MSHRLRRLVVRRLRGQVYAASSMCLIAASSGVSGAGAAPLSGDAVRGGRPAYSGTVKDRLSLCVSRLGLNREDRGVGVDMGGMLDGGIKSARGAWTGGAG